jgi:hypothetical protein
MRAQQLETSFKSALYGAFDYGRVAVYFAGLLVLSIVFTFLLSSEALAKDKPGDEPRDIEQVYTRPSTMPSWSSTFQKYTGKENDIKSVAIVIGISDYSNGWPPLEAPWHDARRVRDFLIQSGFDYVVTLTNKNASKEKIQHYMEDIFPNQVGDDDRFFFYFSGHGAQRPLFSSTEGYLPMIGSPIDGWSTMISMNDIEEWSRDIGQTRHSLFVLDSCFSGLAGLESKGPGLSNVYVEDLLKSGHFLMTAGTKGQESYGSLKQWGGSLFTTAFLTGASGAADSGSKEFPADGVITVTKLYNYIRNKVSAERDRVPQINQTPLLSDLTPKSSGEFFFFSSAGKVQPRLSSSGADNAQLENKGAGLSQEQLAQSKVDEVYKNGLTDFPNWQFGKTLKELGYNIPWDQLPKAGEFPRDDVRYLIVNIKAAGRSLVGYGCISPTSYFVFFFEPKNQSLFRISIRFYDEGVCPDPDIWFTFFANSISAPMQSLDSMRFFQVVGHDVELLGQTTTVGEQPQTVVDVVSTKFSALMTGLEWLTVVTPK